MSNVSRREFVLAAAAGAAAVHLSGGSRGHAQTRPATAAGPSTSNAGDPVELHWLEGDVPRLTAGVTWGVPWPRGAHPADRSFALTTPAGEPVPLQTWTTATWPDGTLKWTAHAIPPGAGASPRLTLTPIPGPI